MLFIQTLWEGIVNGSIYAMIAMGIALVWGVMGILSFSQGEFMMLGMFITFYANTYLGLDPVVCVPIVGLLMFGFGCIVYRTIIAKALRGPRLSQRLITFAIGMVLTYGALMLFGGQYRTVQNLAFTGSIDLAGLTISRQKLVPLIIALVMVAFMYIFLNKTMIGKAIQATSQDKQSAELVGIDSETTYMVAFGLSSALAGIAGCAITYYFPVYYTAGAAFLLFGFIAVLLGGVGSTFGALVGGLIMGVTDTFSGVYLNTAYKYLAVCVIFMLIVTFRPKGLFGK